MRPTVNRGALFPGEGKEIVPGAAKDSTRVARAEEGTGTGTGAEGGVGTACSVRAETGGRGSPILIN